MAFFQLRVMVLKDHYHSLLSKINEYSLISPCIYTLYVFPKQSTPKQVPFSIGFTETGTQRKINFKD